MGGQIAFSQKTVCVYNETHKLILCSTYVSQELNKSGLT